MQVLKEEIRAAIIEQAAAEFFRFGYGKASLRRIARAAGMTIGNLYRYYPSKEAIFTAVVAPAYRSFVSFLRQHDPDAAGHPIDSTQGDLLGLVAAIRREYPPAFDRTLVLLIDGSEGTGYAGAKEELISFLVEHSRNHFMALPEPELVHPDFPRVLAAGFLEGILTILRRDPLPAEKEYLIAELLLFYWAGFFRLDRRE